VVYSQRARRGIDEEEGDGRVVVVTGADGGMAAVTGALAGGGVPTRIADIGTQVALFFQTPVFFAPSTYFEPIIITVSLFW